MNGTTAISASVAGWSMIVLEEQKTKKKTNETNLKAREKMFGFKKSEEDAEKTNPEKEVSNLPTEEEGGWIEDWSDSTLEDAGIGFGLGVLATLVVTGLFGIFRK